MIAYTVKSLILLDLDEKLFYQRSSSLPSHYEAAAGDDSTAYEPDIARSCQVRWQMLLGVWIHEFPRQRDEIRTLRE
jgi:hypothetical protein